MKRMEWGLLCWLVLSLVFHNITSHLTSFNFEHLDLIKEISGSSDHGDDSGSDKGPSGSSERVDNSGVGQDPNGSAENGDNSGVGKDPKGSSEHDDNSGVGQDPNGSSENGDNSGVGKDPKGSSEHGDDSGKGKDPKGSSEHGDDSGKGKGPNGSSEHGDDSGKGKGAKGSSEHSDDSGKGKDPKGSLEHGDDSGKGKDPKGSSEHGDDSGKGKDPKGSLEHGDDSGKGKGAKGSSDHGDDSGKGKDPKGSSEHGDDSGKGKDPKGSSEHGDDSGKGKDPKGSSDHGDDSGVGKDPKGSSDHGDDSVVGKGPNGGSEHGVRCRRNTKDCSDRGDNPGSCNGPKDCSNLGDNPGLCKGCNRCTMLKKKKRGVSDTRDCMEDVNNILKNGNGSDSIEAIESLEKVLEETDVNETTSMSVHRLVAVLHKPKGPFMGLQIYANDSEAISDKAVTSTKVSVQLPRELNVGPDNIIVFCMLTWPEINETVWGASGVLYESRLVGLSVRGKSISGLQEHVNITVNLTGHEGQEPNCSFFNFSTKAFSSHGCKTIWKSDQSQVTCSCNHLTYFGVLMLPSPPSSTDQKILSYISLIGCSLSLISLIITVLLFIRNRKARADISMKVHINLAIALILLNVHFLPNQTVAATSSDGLCLYIALSLHYSLLATFTWMALEGFHLYLLLVKVFNIYIRKYLLKLSLVGWGIPAIIVSLVIIIDRNSYGRVPLNSNSNSTEICYIVDTTVKMVTTVGVFGLVFLFNVTMLGVTIRCILVLRKAKEFGQNDRTRAKRDICTLMGVTTLLGITWGLVFFSFGYLTTAGTYLFCILNSLQGFFIFLWFVMSLGKTGNPPIKTSSETRSTKS